MKPKKTELEPGVTFIRGTYFEDSKGYFFWAGERKFYIEPDSDLAKWLNKSKKAIEDGG